MAAFKELNMGIRRRSPDVKRELLLRSRAARYAFLVFPGCGWLKKICVERLIMTTPDGDNTPWK